MAAPTVSSTVTGLSEQEAQARRARGMGNNVEINTGRTYAEIIRQNVFTFINIVLFTIGAILVSLGRWTDAVQSVGLIVLNIGIGIFQEVRAKQKLDKIALLTRPKISVFRDGKERAVDPADLVVGDVILVRPGDQIVVDGVVTGDGKLEVDESLLTGESDLIGKINGDKVYSGSFAVTGSVTYQAEKVGAESFANKITAQAKAHRVVKTPLQRDIDFIVRLLMLLALFLGFLLLISALVLSIPAVRSVQAAAVTAGIVPNGLFLMVIVAYSLGALRIAGRGALIQQTNAVESLSNVSVLCMDKTGTLTANRIKYESVISLGLDVATAKRLLGDFARSASVSNRTSEAIVEGLPGNARAKLDEVLFSSARKWSALAFDDPHGEPPMQGVYVLGALEMLQNHLPPGIDFLKEVMTLSDRGLRVLLFCYDPEARALHDENDNPVLPKQLSPLCLVSFSDELRDEVSQTIAGFSQAGIKLKVISGDNPNTVAALAKQAGFKGNLTAVSGTDLERMSPQEFQAAARDATIFGRITPEQKERLVEALKQDGNYVAMIGDGVNDVLSLKKANLGIAMQSGSAATRGVADIVLLNDSFASLPPAFLEGQRIINGMRDILRLFLTRAFVVALLILAAKVIGLDFPFVPAHVTLLTFLSVAAPTLGLAIWARPEVSKTPLLKSVADFVLPAAITIFVFGLLVYVGYFVLVLTGNVEITLRPADVRTFELYQTIDAVEPTGDAEVDAVLTDFQMAGLVSRTALTTFAIFTGLLLVIFVEPPVKFFVGGDELSPDPRPTILSAAMLVVFMLIATFPFTRNFFELIILRAEDYLILVVLAVVWAFSLRFVWRRRLLQRFLGLA